MLKVTLLQIILDMCAIIVTTCVFGSYAGCLYTFQGTGATIRTVKHFSRFQTRVPCGVLTGKID